MGQPANGPDLNTLSEEQLLGLRLRELPIRIEGTWLTGCIEKLHAELAAKRLLFRPRCYLAEEWVTPEDEPVIGIPFYLAHPVLTRLEKKFMLEAEGEGEERCMKLLRHETGHAIGYAYKLHSRRGWRGTFGDPQEEEPPSYFFRPHSKSFVRHLDFYYAQYHPDEDFAETFAVWLTPGLDWENRYKGWPALKKLHFMDQLMRSIQDKPPLKEKGRPYWVAAKMTSRLGEHYKRRRRSQAEDYPDFHDPSLRQMFPAEGPAAAPGAADFVKKHRSAAVQIVSNWTGQPKYIIGDLLKDIQTRCRKLKLLRTDPEPIALSRLTAYLTTLVMNHRYTGWFRGEKRK